MAALTGAQTALTCVTASLSTAPKSNVITGPANSAAAGLGPLSSRSSVRSGAVRRRKGVCFYYRGPSALFANAVIAVHSPLWHWDRSQEFVFGIGVRLIIDRGTGGSDGKKAEKKFITKEEEPQQYWQAADEREGKNPMTTPLPYIAILSVLSPFIILAVAFANNWIKVPVR